MNSPILLRCENLAASYDGRVVFRSANLALEAGLYALQGANGIGKSTLLRLLAGAQEPDCGEVWIGSTSLTRQPRAARRLLSYVPAESPIYPFMTGRDLLRFVASVKDAGLGEPITGIVDAFGLTTHFDTRFDAMSLGTQKKMLLCAGFIGAPRIILADEPSNGLDHVSRAHLAHLWDQSRGSGTVLFTSHDAAFIDEVGAARIAMEDLLTPAETPITPYTGRNAKDPRHAS
jgi:ABC-2 type transport system ATP-binding protein